MCYHYTMLHRESYYIITDGESQRKFIIIFAFPIKLVIANGVRACYNSKYYL